MGELAEKRIIERNSIHALEDVLLELPKEDHLDGESLTEHHFAPGVYARELFIPKGSVLTGKIHKTEHLNIVSQGRIAVSTQDGRKIISAPCTFVSQPGTKRAGYALEDTVWTTIHPTEETDLALIEGQVIAKDYSEFEELTMDKKDLLESQE
jgi:hypothetical protein